MKATLLNPKGLWLGLFFLLLAAPVQAGEITVQCDPAISEADCQLVKDVAARIITVALPVLGYSWPPHIFVENDDDVNAYAFGASYEAYAAHCTEELGIASLPAQGTSWMTMMVFSKGLFDQIIEGKADRLALVLGHELGHIIREHSKKGMARRQNDAPTFIDFAYGREEELEADVQGLRLALQAGYDYQEILRAFKQFEAKKISSYSSLEALVYSHPSWKERLSYLDENQTTLWRSMTAFENGVLFLLIENYAAAERAFDEVTRSFPAAYEAWANLGYAYLMQYCDALDPQDLRRFGVGQLLVGGFYRRPTTLEMQVRGINEDLWWDAVGAFKEALRINPNLTLAKANLGVAYLLHPGGKDLGQASRYLSEAADAAIGDNTLDPTMRAAVLINAGVAEVAGGDLAGGQSRFDRAETFGSAFSPQNLPPPHVQNALYYNRAMLLASRPQGKEEAIYMLGRYLQEASSASAWWDLAYDRYAALKRERGDVPETIEMLRGKANEAVRPVTSVEVGDRGVALTEPLEAVQARLGTGEVIPVAGSSHLYVVHYSDLGLSLVATDQVLAITLSGENAPAIPLQGVGLGSDARGSLSLGMSVEDLDDLLYNYSFDFRTLFNPNTSYRFYRDLGVALRVKGGQVAEIIVVMIPERRS